MLDKQKQEIISVYNEIKASIKEVDATLVQHADALQAKFLKNLDNLEKKLLKAEKKNFQSQQNQVKKIRSGLFPNNSLQERVENFMPFYAKWGSGFHDTIYKHTLIFEQQFCIIKED